MVPMHQARRLPGGGAQVWQQQRPSAPPGMPGTVAASCCCPGPAFHRQGTVRHGCAPAAAMQVANRRRTRTAMLVHARLGTRR